MKKSAEQNKTKTKTRSEKIERKTVNDIIQKIVDVHAAVDQTLAEISHTCSNSQRDCEGK